MNVKLAIGQRLDMNCAVAQRHLLTGAALHLTVARHVRVHKRYRCRTGIQML